MTRDVAACAAPRSRALPRADLRCCAAAFDFIRVADPRALPRITIEVLAVHAAAPTHTAICELLVRTHDEEGSVLKVVDVIEFGRDGKIKALRAYKG